MGTDTPAAALSNRSRQLYDYCSQLIAQATNPPLDAIREELITAVCGTIGPEGNLLDPTPGSCRQIYLPHPVLTEAELARIIHIDETGGPGDFRAVVLDGRYVVAEGGAGLTSALDRLRDEASAAISDGVNLLVVSVRGIDAVHAPIPSLLAVGAIHHHLINEKTRSSDSLLVESADAREVHHVALLLGIGA